MTALLLELLPVVASSPGGVAKLRELILQFAVMGKLVPQSDADDPAIDLLHKPYNKHSVKPKGPGRTRVSPQLPSGWCTFNIAEIADIQGGGTPSMSNPDFWNGHIPWISPKDMHAGNIIESELKITTTALENSTIRLLPVGSILIVGRSGILKRKLPVQVTAVPCTINQDLKALILISPIDPVFMKLLLMGHQRQILREDVKQGTTVQSLVYDRLFAREFALPPLAEQHRIVNKVDELMALCDRLDAQQCDAAAVHKQLVKALLDTLTRSKSPTDFASSWDYIQQNFDTLFITEGSIALLKQALLQLAVMGKLVPQNSHDEPASTWLKRMQVKESKRPGSRDKSKTTVTHITKHAAGGGLPHGWEWVRFTQIGELARGKSKHRPRNEPSLFLAGMYPLVQTGDIARANGEVKTYSSLYNQKGLAQSRLWPRGTMCITIAANIADTAILGMDACFPDSVVGFVPFDPFFDVRFLQMFMKTVKSNLEDMAPSTAQKNINVGILESLMIPVPPVAELHRIVAKVDELMTICDRLKSELSAAVALQELLAAIITESEAKTRPLQKLPNG